MKILILLLMMKSFAGDETFAGEQKLSPLGAYEASTRMVRRQIGGGSKPLTKSFESGDEVGGGKKQSIGDRSGGGRVGDNSGGKVMGESSGTGPLGGDMGGGSK